MVVAVQPILALWPSSTVGVPMKAKKGEIARYPIGHFDIYLGEAFARAFADQLAFLRAHVPTPPA